MAILWRESTTTLALRALLLAPVLSGCRVTTGARVSSGVASGAVADPLGMLLEAQHGAELPDQIADSSWWRMVQTMSEPGGYFRSENFVSNEKALQLVIASLRTVAPAGGVYIGVGPEQNFTYIGALRPRIAFIVDFPRQNLLQHLWYKAIFELSPTRRAFLSRLFARPLALVMTGTVSRDHESADTLLARLAQTSPDTTMFRAVFTEVRSLLLDRHGFTLDTGDLTALRYVDSIFFAAGPTLNYSSGSSGSNNGGYRRMPTFSMIATATDERGYNAGFLGSEESYRVVRDLHRRNLVVPLVGNFAGPHALPSVGKWLRAHKARVDVFYTSNVEQYLFQQGDDWSRFYGNVAALPLDTASRFIRSVTINRFGALPAPFLMGQLTSPIVEIVGGGQPPAPSPATTT